MLLLLLVLLLVLVRLQLQLLFLLRPLLVLPLLVLPLLVLPLVLPLLVVVLLVLPLLVLLVLVLVLVLSMPSMPSTTQAYAFAAAFLAGAAIIPNSFAALMYGKDAGAGLYQKQLEDRAKRSTSHAEEQKAG